MTVNNQIVIFVRKEYYQTLNKQENNFLSRKQDVILKDFVLSNQDIILKDLVVSNQGIIAGIALHKHELLLQI